MYCVALSNKQCAEEACASSRRKGVSRLRLPEGSEGSARDELAACKTLANTAWLDALIYRPCGASRADLTCPSRNQIAVDCPVAISSAPPLRLSVFLTCPLFPGFIARGAACARYFRHKRTWRSTPLKKSRARSAAAPPYPPRRRPSKIGYAEGLCNIPD